MNTLRFVQGPKTIKAPYQLKIVFLVVPYFRLKIFCLRILVFLSQRNSRDILGCLSPSNIPSLIKGYKYANLKPENVNLKIEIGTFSPLKLYGVHMDRNDLFPRF